MMPSSVRSKDFVSMLDFEPGELEACLALAARVKRDRLLGRKAPTASALGGAHVALIFEKPSLRTISTFEIAVRELGGDVITPFRWRR
jgi:ornithine carbamoyltransferase